MFLGSVMADELREGTRGEVGEESPFVLRRETAEGEAHPALHLGPVGADGGNGCGLSSVFKETRGGQNKCVNDGIKQAENCVLDGIAGPLSQPVLFLN